MKVNLKPKTVMYPSPAVIATAFDENDNPDSCTLAFAAPISHFPPAIVIGINSTLKRKTLVSILKSKEFCVGFPSANHAAEADYIGIDSSYDVDKIERVGWTFEDGDIVHAPVINELKVTAECKVIDIKEVGSHTQITGEIVNIRADENVLDESGKIDFEKLNPLLYDVLKRDYYCIGDKVADAFNVGLKYHD